MKMIESAVARGPIKEAADFWLSTIASLPRGQRFLQGKASTPGASKPRVWAINGDFLALRPTGVARYAKEVTLALDALVAAKHPLTRDLELSILAPRQPGEPLPLRAIPLRIIPEYRRPRLPQFWVQLQLPRHVAGGLLSFCNLAPIAASRHIVCIHDLHTWLMPNSYGRLFRWTHRVVLPILGWRASVVTTVSTLSRDHLVQFGIAPPEKIVVTYNGSNHVERWRPGLAKLDLPGCRPFILCLGRGLRYKNVELMLQIAPPLDALGLDVCIAGDLDAYTLRQYRKDMPANVRLLGCLTDHDLAKLLSLALCFILPSRIEGFGLPAVEAMALGCPVIASSAPCLPEVCGAAALYADPDDVAAWVDAVRRVKGDADLRRRMVEDGNARAHTFCWQRIAETYLRLMTEVDGGADPPPELVCEVVPTVKRGEGICGKRGESPPVAPLERSNGQPWYRNNILSMQGAWRANTPTAS
jgi:glycosyltransferase involved in cell wall biosynthesis